MNFPIREQNLLNDRIKHFVKSTISNPIRVSVARNIFNMVALKEWEEYRRENTDYYTNVFNRICDSLEKNNNFIAAITELKFLLKVDDVLDERKYALFNAFIEYHRIFHDPNIDNKIELLQRKRDDISKNSALFISKSKEDFLSEKMNEFDQLFKQFFVIKTDNPIVKKKVVEVKQREMLKQQFAEHNNELLQKLGIIKEKYLTYEYHESVNKDKINDILDLIIAKIINGDVSKIEDVMNIKPSRFDEYEMYEKVSKIINRLNSNNITFESKDAEKYRHLILFDGKKYTYNGKEFTEADLYQIKGFKDLKYVFGKVKSEIIQIAKSIDNYSNLTQDDIKTVIDNCPFSDEYYDYNFEYTNMWKMRVMNEFMNGFEESKNILLDDRNYNALCKLFTDGGLAQLALLNDLYSSNCIENQPADSYKIFNRIAKCGLSRISLTEILHNIDSIRSFVGEQNFSIENFGQIIDFKEIFKYADLMDISILGTDTLKKIYSNNGFTSKSQETRIRVACDLVSTMPKKNKSTIPYVNGNVGNYNYSMYDSTDASLLTSGLDTQACFRVCGNDNDFLHYCALDKNGFVIKLTDSDGNFIGRASGFRNGNGVYINQLRTIYDKSSSAYQSEKRSLIDVFDKACKDIVKSSQYNSDEEQKIDFVVVTKSYSLSDVESNVSNEVYNTIGDSPMETKSQDWKDFISTTANLDESLTSNGFTTDFGNYSLICMASAVGKLTPDKIKKGDVPAVYSRPRKKIEIKKSDDKEIERIINKVRAINSHQRKEKFEYLKIPVGSRAIYGDNWYVLFNELGIIDKCCLNEDEIAMQEYEVCYNNFTNSNYISKIIQTAEPTGLRK